MLKTLRLQLVTMKMNEMNTKKLNKFQLKELNWKKKKL